MGRICVAVGVKSVAYPEEVLGGRSSPLQGLHEIEHGRSRLVARSGLVDDLDGVGEFAVAHLVGHGCG